MHPPLARALGKQIAEQARERNIYVATHSAHFLMGAVESGVRVRVVRLQYQDDAATACMLDSNDLKQFMTDPLLRSSNVLSGLFAKSVVVTEADTDRAFYQEVNTRLLSEGKGRGIENAVFLNAQNKQTVPRIVGLLRKMGVPAAGIVDLDVVAEGRTPWAKQMEGIGVPNAMRSSLESLRKTTFDHLKNASTNPAKKGYKTEGGTALLSGQNKEAADSLFSQLATYGLFVVPNGEIEAWLSTLDISRSKHSWLRQVFGKMGSDPDSADYLHPTNGDVWDFIAACNTWLIHTRRKGMGTPQ